MATADSVKNKLQELITKANEATGHADTDLTTAVNTLVAGFGQGGGLPSWIEEMDFQTFTPAVDTNATQTFSLNLNAAPQVILIFADFDGRENVRDFAAALGSHEVNGIPHHSTYVSWNGGSLYGQTTGEFTYNSWTANNNTNPTGVLEATNKQFTFNTPYYGGQFCYWRAAHTYNIVAFRVRGITE